MPYFFFFFLDFKYVSQLNCIFYLHFICFVHQLLVSSASKAMSEAIEKSTNESDGDENASDKQSSSDAVKYPYVYDPTKFRYHKKHGITHHTPTSGRPYDTTLNIYIPMHGVLKEVVPQNVQFPSPQYTYIFKDHFNSGKDLPTYLSAASSLAKYNRDPQKYGTSAWKFACTLTGKHCRDLTHHSQKQCRIKATQWANGNFGSDNDDTEDEPLNTSNKNKTKSRSSKKISSSSLNKHDRHSKRKSKDIDPEWLPDSEVSEEEEEEHHSKKHKSRNKKDKRHSSSRSKRRHGRPKSKSSSKDKDKHKAKSISISSAVSDNRGLHESKRRGKHKIGMLFCVFLCFFMFCCVLCVVCCGLFVFFMAFCFIFFLHFVVFGTDKRFCSWCC